MGGSIQKIQTFLNIQSLQSHGLNFVLPTYYIPVWSWCPMVFQPLSQYLESSPKFVTK